MRCQTFVCRSKRVYVFVFVLAGCAGGGDGRSISWYIGVSDLLGE